MIGIQANAPTGPNMGCEDYNRTPPTHGKSPFFFGAKYLLFGVILVAFGLFGNASSSDNHPPLDADSSHPSSSHWSFIPPERPEIPQVQKERWPKNPIDAFVLAQLEEKGLQPVPEASPEMLMRRLSLDLIGLPPTLEELDLFLQDKSTPSETSYDRLVETLLASPHYGERWARRWLDAARYADTNGYEKDLPRSIWPYRDWVIRAFNQNMPFDQFTVEQLAGDLLPKPDLSQRVATGFHRNTMINEEGGVDPEQFRVESIIDRVDTTGRVFLGLTIACAQCHDHKYDPISQQEYYEFFAFFNNDDEPAIEVPTRAQRQTRTNILQRIAGLEDQALKAQPDLVNQQREWEVSVSADLPEWLVLDPFSYFGAVGTKFTELSDHSLLATASSPPVSTYTVVFNTHITHITAVRLEALTDPNLPYQGPGRAENGNFVLTDFQLDAAPLTDTNATRQVPFQRVTADFSQPDFEVAKALDDDEKTGWGIDAGHALRNQDRKAVFQVVEPFGFANGTRLVFKMKQLHGSQHTIGRFRLSVTTAQPPVEADPLPTAVRDSLSIQPENRSPEQERAVFRAFRREQESLSDLNRQIAEIWKEWPEAATSLVLVERREPRVTRIFRRGDWQNPTAAVSPDVPDVLPSLPENEPRNRLTFARWMVSDRNPLTARVIMNRLWQAYFGRGLVKTPEDFGTQGDPPTHPKLLDWLATEFMDSGWDLKHMHRLIVHSNTYKQSSKIPSRLLELDPYNELLARGPRFRVEAELVRDIALTASGLLSRKVGGPSVYPPIPEGVLSLGYGSPMPWPTEEDEDRYRRAMYTFMKRTVPYPALVLFDAPSGDQSCVRRPRSNTPMQALNTLNDPLFFECARALGLKTVREGGTTDRERAIYAFRRCTSRMPDEKELASILNYAEDQKAFFKNRTAHALKVAANDPANPPEEVDLHQVAVWTLTSRVLLNLDETITKQ